MPAGESIEEEIARVLGVRAPATPEAVKAAYRRRTMELHPDRGGDPARFAEVQRVYARWAQSQGVVGQPAVIDERVLEVVEKLFASQGVRPADTVDRTAVSSWRPPLVEYALATPMLYRLLIALTCVLALATTGYIGLPGLAAFLLPAFFYLVTPEYRANGVLRLSRDGIEVPHAGGAPIAMPIAGLVIHARAVIVRARFMLVPVGSVTRGHLVELISASASRRFSTLTLVEPLRTDALLADLERLRAGQAPTGQPPDPPPPPTDPARDRYDDQLDRELAAMDD